MARYITRVELHEATWIDYENLHRYMSEVAFARTIVADDGVRYDLPTATYFFHGLLKAQEVRALAEQAAIRTGRAAWVLVTEAGGVIAWRLQPTNLLAQYRSLAA